MACHVTPSFREIFPRGSGYTAAVAPPQKKKAKKLELKPNEQILFPQNYTEDLYNPLIITTLRVIWSGDGKKKELDSAKIGTVAKGFHQKFVMVMIIMGLVALPFLAFGGYKYYSYKDKPTEPPPVVKGQKVKPLTQNDLAELANNKTQKIVGLVLIGFGAAFGGVAYLLYKRRLTVIAAGSGRILQLPVKNAMLQDQVIMMINASVTSAKAMAPPPMPEKVQKLAPDPPKLSKK
jgi:hypothetical protein